MLELLKKNAFGLTLVIAASTWGYFGDSFAKSLDSISESVKSLTADTPKAEEATPSEEPFAINAPNAGSNAQGKPTISNPGLSDPYKDFRSKKGSLSSTLSSITPGSDASSQHYQRNAYFDKLSQQLQDAKANSKVQVVDEEDEEEPTEIERVRSGTLNKDPVILEPEEGFVEEPPYPEPAFAEPEEPVYDDGFYPEDAPIDDFEY